MGKRVLVVYYTQTGQTKQILDQFTKKMAEDGHDVEFLNFNPVQKYPFPWSIPTFFNVMPECVNVVPEALQPWQTKYDRYDLVILGWQPWFLSPSRPFNSLLQDEKFKSVIKDTPVVTIAGCRNMWINGQEKNKKLFKEAGSNLVGNVALVDRNQNHVSFITIFYWMGTGKKDSMWGIFPKPGVSEADINRTELYGQTVAKHLESGDWQNLQSELLKQGATEVKYPLMFIERKAGKIFKVWANLINKHPNKRKQLLIVYKYYLGIALLVAAPIILFVDFIFFRPFLQNRIKKQLEYYSGVTYDPAYSK